MAERKKDNFCPGTAQFDMGIMKKAWVIVDDLNLQRLKKMYEMQDITRLAASHICRGTSEIQWAILYVNCGCCWRCSQRNCNYSDQDESSDI